MKRHRREGGRQGMQRWLKEERSWRKRGKRREGGGDSWLGDCKGVLGEIFALYVAMLVLVDWMRRREMRGLEIPSSTI